MDLINYDGKVFLTNNAAVPVELNLTPSAPFYDRGFILGIERYCEICIVFYCLGDKIEDGEETGLRVMGSVTTDRLRRKDNETSWTLFRSTSDFRPVFDSAVVLSGIYDGIV